MKDFLYLLIFNTIIAIFLTVIGFGGDFEINLIFSQCIGISTFLCIKTTLYIKKTTAIVPQLLMITIAMTIGVILGTILGSTVNGIDPLFFFNEKTGMFLQVILIGIMFGSIVTYIFISREMLSNANAAMLEEKMKGIAGEKRVIETNLRLLQNQIEPHFLFNTLSNIMSLIDTDPEKAKSMMEDFIHFLRASLTKTRDQRITLGEEIEIIRSYLNIFKVRMGDRLRYKITVPDILLQHKISPLLIQPLVENAIKHGLEQKIDGGEILIRGEDKGDTMHIEVADTGYGFNGYDTHCGFGLDNIRKRLNLLYNEKGRLILMENQPSGLKAIIEIPYETDKGDYRRR